MFRIREGAVLLPFERPFDTIKQGMILKVLLLGGVCRNFHASLADMRFFNCRSHIDVEERCISKSPIIRGRDVREAARFGSSLLPS